MHTSALILAALSAHALADISLTAFDHKDYNCAGTPIGNEITLSSTDCKRYQPEQPDAYIKAIFILSTKLTADYAYNIDLFSDLDCNDHIGTFMENSTTLDEGGYSGCYPMAQVATGPWGSARVGNLYDYEDPSDNSS